MSTRTPFEITEADGRKAASNGTATLIVDAAGELRRRRAISVVNQPPAAERLLPQVNKLAGDLLSNMAMENGDIQARLQDLISQLTPPPQKRKEWVKATLDGTNVFFDGTTVVVTKEDLWP
jgi:hypothetical protein